MRHPGHGSARARRLRRRHGVSAGGKLERLQCEGVVEKIIGEEGFEVMGWRDTPVDGTAIGRVARGSQPYIEQIFLKTLEPLAEADFERKLYVVRRRIENEIAHAEIEGRS